MKYTDKDFSIVVKKNTKPANWPTNRRWYAGDYFLLTESNGTIVGIYGDKKAALKALPRVVRYLNTNKIVKGVSTNLTTVNNKVDSK